MTTSSIPSPKCAYCGCLPHQGVCPTVKAFEYHQDGSLKRVEFKTPVDYPPIVTGPFLQNSSHREYVATALDRSYPKVAAKIRAGMRSSTWPEDLIDPGMLIDLLEAKEIAVKNGERA